MKKNNFYPVNQPAPIFKLGINGFDDKTKNTSSFMKRINGAYKLTVLVGFLALVVLTGFRCTLIPQGQLQQVKPIVLNWWRAADGPDTTTDIVTNFNKQYTHIRINYQQFRPEEYEQVLLQAWAEDRGPDIFSIPNTWLGKYKTFMLPMPPKITVARQVLTGTIKKDYKVVTENKVGLTIQDLKNSFVGAVANDVYLDSQVWALPMSFDTLALYYNRDLLNQAKVVDPPATWDDFITDVKVLTLIDPQGKIIQSGVAMGSAKNVNYAADILAVLMLQNGTTMASGNGVSFNQSSPDDRNYFPGEAALTFYTDFTSPSKEIYAWNKDMPNSFDAFIQGKAAFYFGYAGDLLKIKNSAPTLNFDIAKMPQITGSLKQANIANYYVEAVSKKTKYPNETWSFVLFATNPANVKSFLDRAKRPTALRALIKDQLNDFDLVPFVNQVLIAQSWYHGRNWPTAQQAMKNMIDDVANGTRTLKESISYYIQIINQTY